MSSVRAKLAIHGGQLVHQARATAGSRPAADLAVDPSDVRRVARAVVGHVPADGKRERSERGAVTTTA